MIKCTNCQKELADTARFCTGCGQAVINLDTEPKQTVKTNQHTSTPKQAVQTSAQSSPSKINKQAIATGATSYYSYFKSALKAPLSANSGNNIYFGYISILILALLNTFTFVAIYRPLVNGVSDLSRSYESSIDLLLSSQRVGGGDYLKVFFFMIILALVFPLIAFMTNRLLLKNNVSLHRFITKYARGFSSAIIVSLVTTLFTFAIIAPKISKILDVTIFNSGSKFSLLIDLQGDLKILIVLISVLFLINVAIFVNSLFSETNNSKIDRLYICIIGLIVVTFVYYAIQYGFIKTLISDSFLKYIQNYLL